MKVAIAREIAIQLARACAAAEADGKDEVDLTATLAAADDKARAQLQAAIDAAEAIP